MMIIAFIIWGVLILLYLLNLVRGIRSIIPSRTSKVRNKKAGIVVQSVAQSTSSASSQRESQAKTTTQYEVTTRDNPGSRSGTDIHSQKSVSRKKRRKQAQLSAKRGGTWEKFLEKQERWKKQIERARQWERSRLPPGISLYSTFSPSHRTYAVIWSPDHQSFICGSEDNTIQIWDIETRQHYVLAEYESSICSIALSPNGQILALGCLDGTIRLRNIQSHRSVSTLTGHRAAVYAIAWSPDGQTLASGSDDNTIILWDIQTLQILYIFTKHSARIRCLSWSPNGNVLASGDDDHTIRLWDILTRQCIGTLDEHKGSVFCLSFSSTGLLLASKSSDGNIMIWRTDIWEIVAIIKSASSVNWQTVLGISFHPTHPLLMTLGEEDTLVRILSLDLDTILSSSDNTPTVSYVNAKIALVGDKDVGKSELGLVLSGQSFQPTRPSPRRQIWQFDQRKVKLDEDHEELREVLLWDMSSQPGYRILNQLYLDDVAVALIVFEINRKADPFTGVRYWNKALLQARRIQGTSVQPLKKFLVQACSDQEDAANVGTERARILTEELGFDGFFKTSAKENEGITKLQEAIKAAINWDVLPSVWSTDLFQRIKTFLVAEKERKQILSTTDSLFSAFLKMEHVSDENEEFYTQFQTSITQVGSIGLIKSLGFSNLILLQPELLDAYASALINTVRNEPDGLGSIHEEQVKAGNFPMWEDERIKDREQEKLLLFMMIEDLCRRELVLREDLFLIFPSESMRERPDLPNPEGKAVAFDFEGPVLNIYATLAVRLSHSGLFKKKDLWKNAITYTANVGGTCGLFLQNIAEGHGKLTLFFDKVDVASEETRSYFDGFVWNHLEQKSLPNSTIRKPIFGCEVCDFVVPEHLIRIRKEHGFNWLSCPGCEQHISLFDHKERLAIAPSLHVLEMNRVADKQRDIEANKSIVEAKKETSDFDVFLCYDNLDKPTVKKIGEQLKEQGLLPWFDEWELRPGLPWQPALQEQIEQVKAVAVFFGKNGRSSWQMLTLDAALRQLVERKCPVIPVILTDNEQTPDLPTFLKGVKWVDFRERDPNPMDQLIWGITGKREQRNL